MSEFIKDFWNNQASKYKGHHNASWGDMFAIELEFSLIEKYIKENNLILDVGCANGFATIEHSKNKKVRIDGIDYAEKMVKYANENKIKHKADNVFFQIGDILDIPFKDNQFDLVYTTRVLINLPNWELQKKAIDECLRVTKEGGKLILLEGFYEPLVKLNSLRTVMGLSPLEEHDFNRYLKKYRLELFLEDKKLMFKNIDFSSIYYLGSRLLREIVTDFRNFEGYSNPINEDFYNLQEKYNGGNFGIQQAYIINK